MKRFLALLLVMAIAFTTSISSSAEDSEINNINISTSESVKVEAFTLDVESEFGIMYDTNKTVIVITYGSEYSQKGENTKVYFLRYKNSESDELLSCNEQPSSLISQEIYKYENVNYPQIFISVLSDRDDETVIRIDEGAFLTEDGKKSGKVEVLYKDCIESSETDFELECKAEAAVNLKNKFPVVLNRSKVISTPDIVGEYADVWLANCKFNYYLNEKLTDYEGNSIVPEKIGQYRAEFELNEQFKVHKYFESTSTFKWYLMVYGLSTFALLTAPVFLVLGAVIALIPGFGTIFGVDMIVSSLYSIPNFFLVLSGKNVSHERIF